MMCSYADLNSEQLGAVQSLEKSLGKTLLAFSCRDINADTVPEEDLKKIRELGDRLCLQLVAVA